ncbi:MAG: acyl carrier protein [Candidatus Avigastranaerophilus sp.]
MKKEVLLEKLTDILQRDELLKPDDSVEDLDSLDKISLIAFFDKELGIKITINDVESFLTVQDILKYIGEKVDD